MDLFELEFHYQELLKNLWCKNRQHYLTTDTSPLCLINAR